MLQKKHVHGGMSMGGMSMDGPVPSNAHLQQVYWILVGSVIAAFALVNVADEAICRCRLQAASRRQPQPARPRSRPLRWYATATAVGREFASAGIGPVRLGRCSLALPTAGRSSLVLANIAVLLILSFYRLDGTARPAFESVGYRTGRIAVCQLPLLFLLAGKRNLIGLLVGVGYERLSWLHRWTARCLWLTATVHMAYWLAAWSPYAGYAGDQIRHDAIVRRGFVAWLVLTWTVGSSAAPIRRWNYELFVLQHVASTAVLLAFVYLHTPADVHAYLWIGVALFFLDRALRLCVSFCLSASPFPRTKAGGAGKRAAFWTCKAEFIPLSDGKMTRISIHDPPLRFWRPGQHVFLSCHSLVPLQSHPFTIASLPHDNRMDFYVRAEKGATEALFTHAQKRLHLALPVATSDLQHNRTADPAHVRALTIDGPYGRMRPLRQFDTVVLFAGGNGVTFTVPLLRDIVAAWTSNSVPSPSPSTANATQGAVTRHVRFIWVVKSHAHIDWFRSQLARAVREARARDDRGHAVFLSVHVYITCATGLASTDSRPAKCAGPGSSSGTAVNQQVPEKPAVVAEETAGACNCTTTVTDQAAPQSDGCQPTACRCCCCRPAPSSALERPGVDADGDVLLTRTGRPPVEAIIRASLEQARGESAVVVCGPAGLADSVRRATVRLSDERAIHKGTGAQGVYLHSECFGY